MTYAAGATSGPSALERVGPSGREIPAEVVRRWARGAPRLVPGQDRGGLARRAPLSPRQAMDGEAADSAAASPQERSEEEEEPSSSGMRLPTYELQRAAEALVSCRERC